MIRRYVFDTGALIGAEKRKQRALDYLALAASGRAQIVTPVVCLLEWWRGRTDAREKLLAGISIEPLSVAAAKTAGEALAGVNKGIDAKRSIDAAVAAHASLSGAPVITSDPDDFEELRRFFPGLRILAL